MKILQTWVYTLKLTEEAWDRLSDAQLEEICDALADSAIPPDYPLPHLSTGDWIVTEEH